MFKIHVITYIFFFRRLDFLEQLLGLQPTWGDIQRFLIYPQVPHLYSLPRWPALSTGAVDLLQLINLRWCIVITQSPWFILEFPLGVASSVDLNKCVITRVHHCGIITSSFTTLKILCAPPSPPSTPSCLFICFLHSPYLFSGRKYLHTKSKTNS